MDRGTIEKIRKIEQQLMEVKQETIDELSSSVKKKHMDGVTPFKEDNSFIVSMSAIQASGCTNLSPHYYSPISQAVAVRQRLVSVSKSGGIDGMIQAIEKMVEQNSVVINHQTYALNPCTVSVLRESLSN